MVNVYVRMYTVVLQQGADPASGGGLQYRSEASLDVIFHLLSLLRHSIG